MNKQRYFGKVRTRRRFRVRKAVRGTAERPRLTVHRSHRNLSCQIIDDMAGKTVVSASTQDKDVRPKLRYGGNRAAAEALGAIIAERALAAGVKQVCFDRGQFRYHGRVAALADSARKAGLSF